jgi:hypothetical protein
MAVMIIGYLLMLATGAFNLNANKPKIDWDAARWVFPYLIGMGIISYFGGFGHGGIIGGVWKFKNVLVGGNAGLPLWWDLLVLAAYSLAVYYMAMKYRLSEEKVDNYVSAVYPPSID